MLVLDSVRVGVRILWLLWPHSILKCPEMLVTYIYQELTTQLEALLRLCASKSQQNYVGKKRNK